MDSKLIRRILYFALFFSFLFSCTAQSENKKIDIFLYNTETTEDAESSENSENEEPAEHNMKKITVELAITTAEQEKGFMQRKIIPEGTGMIFLYKKDKKMHFWMKNTPHPLSIAYIDSSGVIREIYDMQPYSLETVSSIHSVRYALEVPQGMFKRLNLGVGDRLSKKSVLLIKRQLYED